ncbi:MAG: hypothetical protein ACRDPY_25375 [Streptosporangiaceae bacterium]
MSDDRDDLGAPFAMWRDGMTGTDGEFILRGGSIVELGTGLHHLAIMADKYVADHDRQSAAGLADASRSAQAVAPELRERVVREFGPLVDAFKQHLGEHLDQLDPDAVFPIADPFQWMAAQVTESIQGSVADARELFAGSLADIETLGPYVMQYTQALDRQPLLPTMRRALLITAVASAETMLIGILRRIRYDRGGDAQWGSLVNSAKLDKKVRELTRGSIEDWAQRVLDDLGVDLAAASCGWGAVREIWARRHVLVHNRGVVDAMYVRRVPGAALGTVLEVDGDYLRTAIDLLCGFLLGVILMAWAGLPDRQAFAVQFALIYAAGAEAELRWPLAENLHHVAARVEPDSTVSAGHQVNSWLARTRWSGPDSVADAVRAWNIGQLPPRFRLARAILLYDTQAALSMLPDLLRDGEVTRDNLQTWRLFDRLRGTPDFDRLARY